MAWCRVDDNAAFHPKFVAAGNEATGVWIRALAWSNSNLTDGRVPRQIALLISCNRQEPIDALLAARLFEVSGDGFVIHDFADYQPSADEIRSKRADLTAKRSAAGALGAEIRWSGKNGKRLARRSGLPFGKNGKTSESALTVNTSQTANTKSTTCNSKNGKTIANGSQTDSPNPTQPKIIDIGDNDQFEPDSIQVVGFPHFGQLGGKAMAAVIRICPVFGWEIKAAIAAGSPNWGYACKVIESARVEAAKPKPPPGTARKPPQPPTDFGRAEPSTEFGNGDQRI